MSRTYIKVRWSKPPSGEAEWWYSELDGLRWELRKVVTFPDGHSERADSQSHTDYARLSDQKIPELDDINTQGPFEGSEIDAAEFEMAWGKAE